MIGVKRRVLSLGVVAIFLSLTLLRAAVPVEDDIVEQISDPRSDNYYPNLMLRFQVGDSTLTLSNYHYLYYGYAYEEQYRPLSVNPHMDKFLLIASGLNVDNPHVQSLHDVINAGEDALEFDPFNPKVWNLLAYAYGALGDKEQEKMAYRRVEMILTVIRSSGSGVKERSPQHILMFDHALDLLAAENIPHRKSMIISRTVEYIPLISPRNFAGVKVKGFYFDFGRVYWNKPDSVTFKRDRTWQFNNLPPKEYK